MCNESNCKCTGPFLPLVIPEREAHTGADSCGISLGVAHSFRSAVPAS